jgi:hypothetical protein
MSLIKPNRKKISFAQMAKKHKTCEIVSIMPFNDTIMVCFDPKTSRHAGFYIVEYRIVLSRRLTPKNLKRIKQINEFLLNNKQRVHFVIIDYLIKKTDYNKEIISMILHGVTVDLSIPTSALDLIPKSAKLNIVDFWIYNKDKSEDLINYIEYMINLKVKGIKSGFVREQKLLLEYFENYEIIDKRKNNSSDDCIIIKLSDDLIIENCVIEDRYKTKQN